MSAVVTNDVLVAILLGLIGAVVFSLIGLVSVPMKPQHWPR